MELCANSRGPGPRPLTQGLPRVMALLAAALPPSVPPPSPLLLSTAHPTQGLGLNKAMASEVAGCGSVSQTAWVQCGLGWGHLHSAGWCGP